MEKKDVSSKFNEYQTYQVLKNRGEMDAISRIDSIVVAAEMILNCIENVFSNYTIHSIDHSFNVLKHMELLIDNIEDLDSIEIEAIILSALLHDIGMAVFDEEIKKLRKGEYKDPNGRNYKRILERVDNNESLALQEFFREIHGYRSREKIVDVLGKHLGDAFQNNYEFIQNIAKICESHSKDICWIMKLPQYVEIDEGSFNPQFISILLRISDYLDFDCRRSPYLMYILKKPEGKSNTEWKKHFPITNRSKIKKSKERRYIHFNGNCVDPEIMFDLVKYFDDIDNELANSIPLSRSFESKYWIDIELKVDRAVTPLGYAISDLEFKADYSAIMKLLMGEKIYGSRKSGLRELIQNSIDATMTMKAIKSTESTIVIDGFKPKIDIIVDYDQRKFIIKDNGTGMSNKIIKGYFLNVGLSYYQSNEYLDKDFEYKPIGNFGIGFLAVFLLAETVKIKTRYYNETECHTLLLKKNSRSICREKKEDVLFNGTEITIKLDELLKIFKNENEIYQYIQQTFFVEKDLIYLHVIEDSKHEELNVLSQIKNDIQKGNFNDLSDYLYGINLFVIATQDDYCVKIKRVSELNNDYTFLSYNINDKKLSWDSNVEKQGLAVKKNSYVLEIESRVALDEFIDIYADNIDYEDYEEFGLHALTDDFYVYSAFPDEYEEFRISRANIIVEGDPKGTDIIRMNEIAEYLADAAGDYSYISLNLEEYRKVDCLVYCKGILLAESNIQISVNFDRISVHKIVLNVERNDIIPNVARSDFDEEIKDDLRYSIEAALYRSFIDKHSLITTDRNAVQDILRKKYKYNNDYIDGYQ